MRKFLIEVSDFLDECYPIFAVVTWLILVGVLIKLLISGAIR